MSERLYLSNEGRVKAAGLPFTMFTDPAQDYLHHPSSTAAASLASKYTNLRNAPGDNIRDRFFPRSKDTVSILRSGAGLTRTSLSNSQGAGQFLIHQSEEGGKSTSQIRFEIEKQTGHAVMEAHLDTQLESRGYPTELMEMIGQIQTHFRNNDLKATQLAYEEFIEKSSALGITVQRRVKVGREGFFFIRPSLPRKDIKIPAKVRDRIYENIKSLYGDFVSIATDARNRFSQESDMSIVSSKRPYPPLYFQADMLVSKDGETQVGEVHLPDVGFFLLGIDHQDNQTVREAQATVKEGLKRASRIVGEKAKEHKSAEICLITRPEVISDLEDTLEIKELATLKESIDSLGLPVRIISLNEAVNLGKSSLGLLMNIDIEDPAFRNLLMQRLSDESVPIYPDPFLLLMRDRLTHHKEVSLSREQLSDLRETFKILDRTGPARDYALLGALNTMFTHIGLPEDSSIFHLYIPGQPTPVPFYRYDTRGIQIALNYADSAENAVARAIPVTPDNAILFNEQNEPIYTLFRYMITL